MAIGELRYVNGLCKKKNPTQFIHFWRNTGHATVCALMGKLPATMKYRSGWQSAHDLVILLHVLLSYWVKSFCGILAILVYPPYQFKRHCWCISCKTFIRQGKTDWCIPHASQCLLFQGTLQNIWGKNTLFSFKWKECQAPVSGTTRLFFFFN